jgi:hypothetical protein
MKIQKKSRQGGFVVTVELLIVATVLVLGLIVGWAALRDSELAELSDVSESVGALNQGYNIASLINTANTASTAGSSFRDSQDTANVDGTSGKVDMTALNGDSKNEYTFAVPTTNENTVSPALP